MLPRRYSVTFSTLTAIAALLVASAVHAQNTPERDIRAPAPTADVPDRRQDVIQRHDTAEPALGYRVGGFRVNPRIAAGLSYDDNIFATQTGKKSDFIFNGSVGARAQTEMTQHFFGLDGQLDYNKFADNGREDFYNANLDGRGRYDIDAVSSLGAEASVRRLTEPRDAPDETGSNEPLEFMVYRGAVNGQTEFGRFVPRLEAGVVRQEYDGGASTTAGVPIRTGERDRNEAFVNGTFGFRYLGPEQVYVRLQANDREYDQTTDNSGFQRSSNGYRAELGATADLGGLIFADVAVGYQEQKYDDSRLGTPGDFVWSGSLLWNPTRLTSVRAETRKEFSESFNTGSPGYWRTLHTLTVAHELRFNLVAFVRGVYQTRDFDKLPREDEVIGGDIGLKYRLDRGLFLDGEYRYRDQDTKNSSSSGYSRSLALVRVRKTF